MERAAEKGKAIVAAVEGPNSFIEPFEIECLGPICLLLFRKIQSRMVTVSPTDSVLSATQKMLELRLSAAVVTVENKPRGILTSKDLLMRVIAQNLSPESTLVEKVCSASC
ncbi:hypothetical protein GIB67_041904 [Kingdonia uniflora]|uniref:CBS domain-containing protein n=1 Tax=Kingdonia uniflora TaxID=39325 RepID=A0A7J7MEQ6_9MAGN|nr:hypothetical protein GIB67_041904 [Kingdonia uniflora]